MSHPPPSAEALTGSEGTAKESGPINIPEEVAILEVVNKFLSCIKNKDRALMHSLVLPKGATTLIRRGKAVHLSLDEVVERIPVESKMEMDEQIYNCRVHVDGDLGVAWTPYLFLEDGRLNHTGTNIFNMWKTESKGWIITGVADIAREVNEKAFDAFGEAEEWKKSQSS